MNHYHSYYLYFPTVSSKHINLGRAWASPHYRGQSTVWPTDRPTGYVCPIHMMLHTHAATPPSHTHDMWTVQCVVVIAKNADDGKAKSRDTNEFLESNIHGLVFIANILPNHKC